MKSNPAHQRLKSLLKETITLLCKNGLEYKDEFCIEALIGITLDKDDIVLVNINETIKSAEAELKELEQPQSSQQEGLEGGQYHDEDSVENNFSPSAHTPRKRLGNTSENDTPSRRKKRRRRRSGSSSNGGDDQSNGSFSEPEESKSDIFIIKEEPGDSLEQSGLSFDPDLNWSQSDPHLTLPQNPPIHGASSSSAMFNTSQHSVSGLSHSQSQNTVALPGSLQPGADDSTLSWTSEGGSQGQNQSMLTTHGITSGVRKSYSDHELAEALVPVVTGVMNTSLAARHFNVSRPYLSMMLMGRRKRSERVMELVEQYVGQQFPHSNDKG